ncbi:MAG TPA: hypothetical protein PLJ21_02420, partial [Pseudobdellovibrionaceae bacterium]|nr:hypothetical protein [Pseudobdellovibrionaceae bacterium]
MDIKNIMVLLFTSSAVLMLYQNCSEQFEDSGNPKSKEETNYNSETNIDPTSTEESNNNSENIPVVKNTDPGVGSWLPLGTPDRLIADQSGQSVSKVSYVPGCLNGNNIISASASGCGGNSIFEGPIAGSSSLIS